MSIDITVTGEGALKSALDKMVGRMESKMREAVSAEAEALADDERSLVPVATGALRAGIEVSPTDGGLGADVGINDPALIYAIWVEWGKAGRSGTPFATPAAERSRQRWPSRAAEKVKEATGG